MFADTFIGGRAGRRQASHSQLQRYLASFDTQLHGYTLSPTAVDAMLSVDRHLTLPHWLRSQFEVRIFFYFASHVNPRNGCKVHSLWVLGVHNLEQSLSWCLTAATSPSDHCTDCTPGMTGSVIRPPYFYPIGWLFSVGQTKLSGNK